MKKPHPSSDQSPGRTGRSVARTGGNEEKKTKKSATVRTNSWRPPHHRIQGIHEAFAWQYDHPESGKPLVNCQSLAEKYGVVSETIRRDIEFMQDTHNLPIEYIPSRHGYVYTERVSFLPTTQFTQSELSRDTRRLRRMESPPRTRKYPNDQPR